MSTPTPEIEAKSCGQSVDVLGVGMAFPDSPPAPYALPPELGGAPCVAYACAASPAKGLVPPNRLRRLGRAQSLALASAALAVKDCPHPLTFGDSSAVALGTGMGEQGETADFLTRMFATDEAELRPAHFVNSVHNSMASQIAMMFGMRGDNYTFTHGAISFELALEAGVRWLRAGRADVVLACGADMLTPYLAAAGVNYGWWRRDGAAVDPMSDTAAVQAGTLPGEGAAAFLLARRDVFPEATRIARIACATALPLLCESIADLNPEAEAAFVHRALAPAGMELRDVSFVLYGANGDAAHDAAHGSVDRALAAARGTPLPCGVYKHRCGEFCAAPALGVALAVEAVRHGCIPDAVACRRPPRADASITSVLVYSISSPGHHSVCLVTA